MGARLTILKIMSVDRACSTPWSFHPCVLFHLAVSALQTVVPAADSSNVMIISLEGRPINCYCDPYAFFVR